MTDVPVIAIDEIEDDFNDDSSLKLNINDCHTDVEELESDHDRKKVTLISVMKPKCNGALTDVEDFEDSDDNNNEEEPDYGPELSLTEMLDQGTVDEHSNLQGNVNKQKLQGMRSIQKTPSPTAFHLTVNSADLGGTTDVEDLEGSGDDADDEKIYSDDDKPIVLEDGNVVDVHDSMNRKKTDCKYATKIIEASSSSSESENEKEKPTKLKSHKQCLKRGPRCEEEKSDVENIYFTDDEKKRSTQKSTPVLDTPDVEVMAFEGSDNDDNEQHYPEINITFAAGCDGKKKKKHKATPAPSPMLKLPENPDEALTDVENLNSSDDDEEDKPKSSNFMQIAVVKSEVLTDVEDFDSESDIPESDCENKPEIVLPSPVREITVLVENKSGEPYKQTTPLPDNILLGFEDLDADKGMTDIEDFSDESGNEEDDEDDAKYRENFKFPDIDGGVVESSDHSVVKDSSLRAGQTPEPKTDTEDIYVKKPEKTHECRRRRNKNKHCNKQAVKSNFLDTKSYVDDGAGSAHTDVEDLHVEEDDILLKDKNIKQRRATIECSPRKFCNYDEKTDIEFLSDGDDTIQDIPDIVEPIVSHIDTYSMTMSRELGEKKNNELKSDLAIPIIRRISATPQPTPRGSLASGTDIENIQCDSDNDEYVTYSRAETATPIEINRQLEELCSSEIFDMNKRGCDESRERLEVKGHYDDNAEAHTDIEYLD